jgi:hypothetical protein
MDEPPGGHGVAKPNQPTRFTDEEIAARLAPYREWLIIALGIGCLYLGSVLCG